MDIRDNLKNAFVEKGLSQAAIAKKVGLTPMQLSQTLRKERKLEANELLSICETIEVTPSELVERYGASAPATGAPDSLMAPGA